MIKIITMIITATITILKGNNEDYYQHSCCSAVSYDEQNARVSVVYNDHSLYIWDVRDIRKVRLLPQNSYFSSFLIITVFLEMLLGKYFSFVYAGKQVFVFEGGQVFVFTTYRWASRTRSCSTPRASGASRSTRPPLAMARRRWGRSSSSSSLALSSSLTLSSSLSPLGPMPPSGRRT